MAIKVYIEPENFFVPHRKTYKYPLNPTTTLYETDSALIVCFAANRYRINMFEQLQLNVQTCPNVHSHHNTINKQNSLCLS